MAFFATASAPTSALETLTGIVTILLPPLPTTQRFVVAEISYYQPQTGSETLEVSTAASPTAAITLSPFAQEIVNTLYISDLGYITKPIDSIGQVVFEPTLVSGWKIDRNARLEPWASSGSVSWGSLAFIDPSSRYTPIFDSSSIDGRPVSIRTGFKTYDASRGIFTDPPYGDLNKVFAGVARGLWRRNGNSIEVDIRDASYQGEKNIQSALYGGTGGYDGSSNIKGRPLPFCRGGTASNPIENISPILIDPTNNIWQYNDGPGTIINLYENSGEVFTFQSDTTDLYSGSTSAGSYRTDNSRGLFQLGSPAQGEITADVTGAFPVAGAQTTAANIARYILTETVGIDSTFIDSGSFIGLNSDRPYTSGIYITEPTDAMSVVDYLLKSVNAWLTPTSSGTLQAVLLRAPSSIPPSATYSYRDIASCAPRSLPELLNPPPYRIRIAFKKRNTIQNTSYAGAATEDRKQFVAEPWSYATWIDTNNLTRYRTSSDPTPVETALLVESEAQSVVDEIGGILGVKRALYDLEMPIYLFGLHEIGDMVIISYPGILNTEVPALVLGESVDSTRSTFTLRVMV